LKLHPTADTKKVKMEPVAPPRFTLALEPFGLFSKTDIVVATLIYFSS